MRFGDKETQAKYETDIAKWEIFMAEIKRFVNENMPERDATSSELGMLEGKFKKIAELVGRLPFVKVNCSYYKDLAICELYERYRDEDLSSAELKVKMGVEMQEIFYVYELSHELQTALRDMTRALQSCSSVSKKLMELEGRP